MSSWDWRRVSFEPASSDKGFGLTTTMIWRWLIFFSIGLLPAPLPGGAATASVNGAVEITNSHEPAVRRNRDYSGVVLWLEPLDRADAPRPTPKHVQMV